MHMYLQLCNGVSSMLHDPNEYKQINVPGEKGAHAHMTRPAPSSYPGFVAHAAAGDER